MPIYEYKCSDCDLHFERMQKITEETLKICEECGGSLVKQWSLSGFQFKGAGWYVTDYAGKKSGKETDGKETEKSEKTEKTEKSEKSSTAESTAGADSASKKETDSSAGSKSVKKETGSEKV